MHLARAKKRLIIKIVISLFLLVVICFGLFVFEYLGYDERIRQNHPHLGFVGDLPKVLDVFYWPIISFRKSPLPFYQIIIDPKDLKSLEESLSPDLMLLSKEYRKRVPAKFIYNNKTYDVRVGFRGARRDHWAFEKKSWRVIFKEPDYFFGFSEINLIIPETREFLSEEVNNYRAKKLGLIVPPSRFVQVKINNKYYGAYWEIEQWGKDFLEKQRLSPDTNFYADYNPDWPDLYYFPTNWKKYTSDKVSEVDNFAEMNLLLKLFTEAADSEFWQKIPLILDLDNFYRWHVLNTISGTIHSDSVHNARLYFNNIIGKFQFFPTDVSQGLEPSVDVNYNVLANRILKNPEFLHQRNQILHQYVKDDKNLDDDLAYYKKLYKETKIAFYKDKGKLYSNFYFDKKIRDRQQMFEIQYRYVQEAFKDNGRQAIIFDVSQNQNQKSQTNLNLVASFEVMVKAFSDFKIATLNVEPEAEVLARLKSTKFYLFYDKNNNQLLDKEDLKLGELNYQPQNERLELASLESNIYSNLYTQRTFTNPSLPTIPLGEPVELVSTLHHFFLATEQKNLPLTVLIFKKINLELAKVISGEVVEPRFVYVDATTFENLEAITIDLATFLKKQPIFRKSGEKEIVLPAGSYNINESLIIPKGVVLKINPGVKLSFAPAVSLISYSPIIAQGTKNQPIIFTAQNKNKPWGVVGVIQTAKSIFDYTIFEYGSQAYSNGIFFSGTLALYYTDGEISNSQIRYATGDDGINVKYGKALINNNYFYKNNFDGLDLDWSDSEVINNVFEVNGNDGIDISGSLAKILNNLIKNSGDKGISVGENSQPLIFNNILVGGNTGIASKDLSEPKIINNVIYQNNEGISLFEKKPIFGGAKAQVFNTIIWGNKEEIKLDDKSKIEIQYSDIEGGFIGEGNVDIKPKFLDNYLTTPESELNKLGTKELLEEIFDKDLKQALGLDLRPVPIGLIKELWPR